VAAPGLENIARLEFLGRDGLEKSLGFKLGKLNFVVTYHPVTLSSRSPADALKELFSALDAFPEAKIFLTRPNADSGGDLVGQLIEEYARKNSERAVCFASLGSQRYLSLARLADIVIGNSSSGIIEIPALRRPTVNIGDRQRGRLAARSIINCPEDRKGIVAAIRKALSPEFQEVVEGAILPYGSGHASIKIKEELKSMLLNNVLMKKFYDLNRNPISLEEEVR
jgi:UDP-hydrolysing UDP-N-acetyl-D-glucosamine 2-epimerase